MGYNLYTVHSCQSHQHPGLEVIKLEYSLRLKIKRNDWLLAGKQPIIVLYFESENELEALFFLLRLSCDAR